METGRMTMDRLRREFRQIKDIRNIPSAGSAQLQVVDSRGDTLTYTFSSDQLIRQVNSGAQHLLADNVVTAQSFFRYYSIDGDTLSSSVLPESLRLRIWTIQIHVTLSEGDEVTLLDSKFFPENLRNGIVRD